LNEAKWDKIRKEISKENKISTEKRRSKRLTLQLTRVKSNGMSIRKLQLEKSKPVKFSGSTKTQEYSPFSENNQAFYSITDFSFHFTTVSEGKLPF